MAPDPLDSNGAVSAALLEEVTVMAAHFPTVACSRARLAQSRQLRTATDRPRDHARVAGSANEQPAVI